MISLTNTDEDGGDEVDASEVDQDECGYCGTGTDPEIMCADCWSDMQEAAG